HPMIVRVHDLVYLGEQAALVMELIDGEDLASLFGGQQRLPPRLVLEVISGLADALSAAYNTRGPGGAPLRLVHRDVKPANVRIGRHGQLRLLDLGVAWSSADRASRTATGLVVGSLPYMAPERFRESEPQAAGDIFAIGCLLYEGLAGEPFHPRTGLQALARLALDANAFSAHRDERLARLPGLPETLRALLVDALAHDPEDRPLAGPFSVRAG